jgi:hypothetical protein
MIPPVGYENLCSNNTDLGLADSDKRIIVDVFKVRIAIEFPNLHFKLLNDVINRLHCNFPYVSLQV